VCKKGLHRAYLHEIFYSTIDRAYVYKTITEDIATETCIMIKTGLDVNNTVQEKQLSAIGDLSAIQTENEGTSTHLEDRYGYRSSQGSP
jgi:hypothetical protein